MARKNRTKTEFNKEREKFLHVHFLHKHVPFGLTFLFILLLIASSVLISYFIFQDKIKVAEITVSNEEINKALPSSNFSYGSHPSFENKNFFEKVKKRFISKKTDFIEADLSKMELNLYKKGELKKQVPILSKGRPGSWWQTPAGVYKVQSMRENLYSSFGRVYMPWSMQFQGNFFIHGWPYYPGGRPVEQGYSGGCIRISKKDAEEIYSLSHTGMPVLVFEKALKNNSETTEVEYAHKGPSLTTSEYFAADLKNQFIFAEANPQKKTSLSSLTKFMTALVAVEYINVEKEIEFKQSMATTTKITHLKLYEEYTVLDLLSLLLMENSNEAAKALTKPLGEHRFTQLMEEKASALGMRKTSFTDSISVSNNNVSTAHDLFMLARYLYYNRGFILKMSIGKEDRGVYSESEFRDVKNLNKIKTSTDSEIVGGKIDLGNSEKKNGLAIFKTEIAGKERPIAIIVLDSSDPRRDIKTALDYIHSNYTIEESGNIIKEW